MVRVWSSVVNSSLAAVAMVWAGDASGVTPYTSGCIRPCVVPQETGSWQHRKSWVSKGTWQSVAGVRHSVTVVQTKSPPRTLPPPPHVPLQSQQMACPRPPHAPSSALQSAGPVGEQQQ